MQIKFAIAFSLMTALILGVGCAADTANSPTRAKSVISNAEQMKALRREADEARAAAMKAPEDQAEKFWNVSRHIDETNLPKLFELARQAPASEAAFETYNWAITNQQIQGWSLNSNGLQAVELLCDYHATNPNAAKICWIFGESWDPTCQPAISFLRIAASKNPSREARGQATLALARLTARNARYLQYYENAPHGFHRFFEKFGSNFVQEAKSENPETLSQEAEKLFRAVLKKYANCPTLEGTNVWLVQATLGEVAKAGLYELHHLTVGKVAPDIKGRDLDGKKLRLSEFRGKVVVLSFWASWCGACMQMVPGEVTLAKKMKGKPFALLGVNGDPIRADAERAVEREKMTWRSFWSKGGPSGPIPTDWNVRGWPTVFVLDPNGVIRYRFTGYGPETESILDREVEQLLRQSAGKIHS